MENGQAPNLNNLQPHPDREARALASAARAAEELATPTTEGQRAAVSGEGGVDIAALRERVKEARAVEVHQVAGGEITVDAETGEELHEYFDGHGEEGN